MQKSRLAIDSISGSLWGNRNSTTPIENKDHTLFITGSSPHEIASVQILVNGNAVVAEKTCEDTSVPPDHHCEHVTLEWITNAAEHAPGQLNLEVVVTDFLGHSTGERFFVTIPQQPPPGPEEIQRPSFASTKLFREEYGLDRNKSLTEEQLNHLILELLFEWELQQATQVKGVEEWGIPMRQPELEEMEYRRRYTNQAAEVIPQWSEEHASSSYGGFYVDDRVGGRIYVGFTENQHGLVESLKQTAGLINPGVIYEYPTPPTRSVSSLNATTLPTVSAAIEGSPSIDAVTSVIYVAPEGNVVQVGATNPEAVRSFLASQFGQNAPIKSYTKPCPCPPQADMRQGMLLQLARDLLEEPPEICAPPDLALVQPPGNNEAGSNISTLRSLRATALAWKKRLVGKLQGKATVSPSARYGVGNMALEASRWTARVCGYRTKACAVIASSMGIHLQPSRSKEYRQHAPIERSAGRALTGRTAVELSCPERLLPTMVTEVMRGCFSLLA